MTIYTVVLKRAIPTDERSDTEVLIATGDMSIESVMGRVRAQCSGTAFPIRVEITTPEVQASITEMEQKC